MSLVIRPGPPRDVTRELTQAFQLSNLCRELAKTKLIPGTRRILGSPRADAETRVEEPPAPYPGDKENRP